MVHTVWLDAGCRYAVVVAIYGIGLGIGGSVGLPPSDLTFFLICMRGSSLIVNSRELFTCHPHDEESHPQCFDPFFFSLVLNISFVVLFSYIRPLNIPWCFTHFGQHKYVSFSACL